MEFKTKEDYVAEFLREGIIAGRYARGVRLKQDQIAADLKISITPVREAFRMLEAEGYLQSERHRGVVVAPFDAATANELTALRVLLECRLVASVAKNITRGDLAKLREIQDALDQAARRRDHAQIRALNYRFHSYLYSIARLPHTLRFVQIMWAKYPFDLIHKIKGRPGRAVAEHRVLLRAFASGDEETAVEATRTHIEAGWRELSSHLKTEASSRQRPRGSTGRRSASTRQ